MKRSKGGLVLPDGASALLETPHATLTLFAYADVKPDTQDCILRDMRLWPNLIYTRISNDAAISRSRSRIASDFLQSKPELTGDVLLMIDHDMTWQAGDLQYLAEKALETEAVVAGVYSKRDFGGGVAVRFAAPGTYTIGEDLLAPAQYVSAGFLAIHRKVLEKVAKTLPLTIGNFWPFFLEVVAQHPMNESACEWLSEDWAFCARARDCGFPVYAAMKPRLVHIGEYGYRLIDSQATPPPDQAVNFQVNEDVEAPAIRTLLADVAEYTAIAPDSIHRAVSEARTGLVALWQGNPPSSTQQEVAWYRRGDVGRHYILDLAGWHATSVGALIHESLKDVKDKRVLDFGSGIGTMALLLAGQGNEVDCIEINGELRKFAEYRAGRSLNGAKPPRFVTAPDGEYDLVIAWHVFEHLPDPEEKLAELVAALKPGGRMWSQSDWVADPVHIMHHERTDWEECMAKAGLKAVEPNWYEKVAPNGPDN